MADSLEEAYQIVKEMTDEDRPMPSWQRKTKSIKVLRSVRRA